MQVGAHRHIGLIHRMLLAYCRIEFSETKARQERL